MITVLAAVGLLASVAINQLPNLLAGSKDALARDKLEMLNRGVHAHQEANYKDNLSNLSAVPGDFWDEIKVLQQLQYRHPTNPAAGSPYVPGIYRPDTSSSSADYRIYWTGSLFTLIPPGTAGVGIKVVFDGSDIGEPYNYPPTYKWTGR